MTRLSELTNVAVEYPRKGEIIRSPEYTLRIAAPHDAERVELSINGGGFTPARQTEGRWWFDWSGYGTGLSAIVLRVTLRGGFMVVLPPHEVEIELEGGRREGGRTTQYSVTAPNKPGALARLMQLLTREGVEPQGVATERYGDTAAIRFVAPREAGLRETLEDAGYSVLENEVLRVELQSKAAELNRLARQLAEGGINILSFYSTVHNGKTQAVVTVDQPEAAARLLTKAGHQLVK